MPQQTYPLSHFRQHTDEHLERLAEGRVETLTRNGEATMVVMSPERYELMKLEIERGKLWDQAIERLEQGEQGVDAFDAIDRVASRLQQKQ